MKGIAFLLIATANVLGGISYVWQDLALEGLPPATIILGRNAVAILCMLVFLALRPPMRLVYPRGDLVRLMVIGILAYGAPLLLGIVGV